ncbi:MAG: type II toxin-antitoxin system VapC family toxin [Rhodospirillaceae bacterium]|nr:type II toxin-antitoxin system VapC family toxin [Rhodospirillaceae bacterium]
MLGFDTNILVRYVVRDDPIQNTIADRLLENDLSPENPGFVNHIVLVEFVWVLDRTYRFSRDRIARALDELLNSERLVIERQHIVERALKIYKSTRLDLADILINYVNEMYGCTSTLTLDRGQAALPSARVVP